MRAWSAATRSSLSREISAAISGPPSMSAYGWPRHRSSAWRNRREAVAGSSGRPAAPSRYRDSKRPASVSSAATVNT